MVKHTSVYSSCVSNDYKEPWYTYFLLNMNENFLCIKVQSSDKDKILELVSKELNHLAAILHVYAGGLNFMK